MSWWRNGLESVGKGASDGGSVGVDFSDCAFYPTYTRTSGEAIILNSNLIKTLVSCLFVGLLGGCIDNDADSSVNDRVVAEAEAAAGGVLERHMVARNNIDAEAIAEEDNYPQYRFAAGTVARIDTSEIMILIEENVVQPAFEASGWDHSEWDIIEIVQSSENKVHFALVFSRFDALGNRYLTTPTFWVVTNQDNHWGLKLRASFAEESGGGGDVAEAETAAINVLKSYLDARNNRDSESLAAIINYPLVFLSDVDLHVFETIDEYVLYEETVVIPDLDYSDWGHSEWEKLDVIQSSNAMVNIIATLNQFDVMGNKFLSQDQFWIITKNNGDWKIQAQSNFVDAIQRHK